MTLRNNYWQAYMSARKAYLRDNGWKVVDKPGGHYWSKDPHPGTEGEQGLYLTSDAADLQEMLDEDAG